MSRLTFRDPQQDVAWQRQLRDKYADEGTPPVPHLSVKKAMVRPVSRRLAAQIILKYEWLGTMSPTSWHYGIFFGGYCAGVTCVGSGATMAGAYHHEQFQIERGEMLTLARGACVHWAPEHTNSRLVSMTCKLAAKEIGGKLIWATADTDAGEIGTIYQACNWVYIGISKRSRALGTEIVSPKGRAYNDRSIGGWGKKRGLGYAAMKRDLLSAGWLLQASNPKHRYVYVLDKADKALVDRVERMRQPYPKRESEHAAKV